MAANVSVIGRTARVRGRVIGASDLEVRGWVEGEIAVTGDVTIDAHGIVGAGVRGRRLVVRGAVKGDLVGQEAIALEEGARVVGDLRAPRVSIAPGAMVRGLVETSDDPGVAAAAARSQQASRATPAATAKPTAAAAIAARAPAVPPPPATSAATTKMAAATKLVGNASGMSTNSTANHSAARRPPPPVVPALKKAKGQIAKRKER
jgi:cytoskeletal protein CcmA (bactofilin family)